MRVFAFTAAAAAAVLIAVLGFSAASVAQAEPRHGLSAFGDLKYPADFAHFDYVNPDAPKGGRLVTTPNYWPVYTFDSLNPFIVSGDAAQGMLAPENLYYDSLMTRAFDEPDAVYGLVAHSAELIPGESVTFYMRPEARFADGSPVTAHDVAFSFTVFQTAARPMYRAAVADVTGVTVVDDHTVRFDFDPDGAARNLPMIVAGLPILSRAWHEEGGHDPAEAYLDIPLNSGPYEITEVVPGRLITYRRRSDYWGADLPVNVGRWNFDEIAYRYYGDRDASRQALFAGEVDVREEYSSKSWALDYEDAAPVNRGDILRDTLPDATPSGAQGFFLNTRREKFADPRVREALGLAFNFEWSNDRLFYGLYTRTDSFFEGAPFEAAGEPAAAELALLEPFRGQIPDAALGAAVVPPVSDSRRTLDRRQLRRAAQLLTQAGWTMRDGVRVNAAGEPLEVEFLEVANSGFERIIRPYIENLRPLGVRATLVGVDPSQYVRRQEEFDFDVVTARISAGLTPGPELRDRFSTETADQLGSYNLAGIRSAAVDALLTQAIDADHREAMHTALRAADRVLRAGYYWVPQWSKSAHTIAYWDKYARPETKPLYARGVLDTWWRDADRAAALTENQD